ncbi:MAG: SDR family oxidoreductase [Neisseriaceae bacterium]|nr:MAG: SDR family oxidoreductase [Neisseriaceae bacterium]
MVRVDHPVAIITGASRGIGAAIALLLARHKYKICVNYNKNQLAAQDIVRQIEEIGGAAIAVQADVAVEEQIVRMFSIVDQKLGQINALVNNAGILFPQTSVEHLTAARINQILQTNVTGTFICCREAIKRMTYKNGGAGGSIVNISSRAAVLGSPHEYVDYAASKGAIDTITTGLALELADQGIRVNAVRPGIIYTEMHASGGEADRVERLKSKIPMQRGGYPNEVAEAVYWLLSEKASFTTGSFIDVAGGR